VKQITSFIAIPVFIFVLLKKRSLLSCYELCFVLFISAKTLIPKPVRLAAVVMQKYVVTASEMKRKIYWYPRAQ
jgi:hypothetical protein